MAINPVNIQFGAGGNILDGFINHDADVPIENPLPYQSGSVDLILIEHCLEHVDTLQGFSFMQEAHRILRPGGCLRICIPVLTSIVDRTHAADLITGHGHRMLYSPESLKHMLFAAGFDYVKMHRTFKKPCDGHWKVIGLEKDALETYRLEVFT